MVKGRIVLIVKVVISLTIIVSCFFLASLYIVSGPEETRDVIDTVVSSDGAHKVIVTRIGNSYGYDETIEFALCDDEGKVNAVFVDHLSEYDSGKERYSIELGQEQASISVIDQPDKAKGYKIVVGYNDLVGRDVITKDYGNVVNPICAVLLVLFAVSAILLMFIKKRKFFIGLTSAAFMIIYLFLFFGFRIGRYDLALNNVICEDENAIDQKLWLKNENYEFFQDRLNKVDVMYHCQSSSSDQENISLTTYVSGKIDNSEIDVVYFDSDSLSITFHGEDPFAFTLIRE